MTSTTSSSGSNPPNPDRNENRRWLLVRGRIIQPGRDILSPLEVWEDGSLLVDRWTRGGVIVKVWPSPPSPKDVERLLSSFGVERRSCGSEEDSSRCEEEIEEIQLSADQFCCPGLIDTHVHAPQFLFMGTGTDKPLMEWLEAYTFPAEREMKNVEQIARPCYRRLVTCLLSHGTTTANYFATVDENATMALAEECSRAGQRCVVGKVGMDRCCPDDYRDESVASCIESYQSIIVKLREMNHNNEKRTEEDDESLQIIQGISEAAGDE